VKGIAFMGTPHLGSDVAAATKALRGIANVVTGGAVRNDLLKMLERNSRELQHISEQFVLRGSSLEIASMYEQLQTKRMLVGHP
jgi:cell division FtsZ-interacting protein ZapD